MKELFDRIKDAHLGRDSIITEAGKRRESAILIPIVELGGEPHLLFESRAKNLNLQPGETCFPGGGIYDNETSQDAAIRESCEELLIDPSQIELICPLDGRQGPKMQIVWAYLARIYNYNFTYSPAEVDHVFTVPVSYFMNNDPVIYKMHNICEAPADFPSVLLQNDEYRWRLKDFIIPVYSYDNEYIWGFTARCVCSLISELRD